MHSRQIRRVNLSLHLSPEHSRADLRAMQQLKKWHDALQQAGSDAGEVNMQMRRFHRSVYLAGLQLYLMSPPLCSHVAESLGREALTPDALWSEMQRDGLLEAGKEAAPQAFSDAQLAQMRELMAQAIPAGRDDALAALRDEVAALRALLAEKAPPAAAPCRGEADNDDDTGVIDFDAVPMAKMKKIRQKGIF